MIYLEMYILNFKIYGHLEDSLLLLFSNIFLLNFKNVFCIFILWNLLRFAQV